MFFQRGQEPPPEEKRVLLSSDEFKTAMMRLISSEPKLRDAVLIPRTYGPVVIKTREEKILEATFESCIFKCLMSCVLGEFLIQIKLGLFGILKFIWFDLQVMPLGV